MYNKKSLCYESDTKSLEKKTATYQCIEKLRCNKAKALSSSLAILCASCHIHSLYCVMLKIVLPFGNDCLQELLSK